MYTRNTINCIKYTYKESAMGSYPLIDNSNSTIKVFLNSLLCLFKLVNCYVGANVGLEFFYFLLRADKCLCVYIRVYIAVCIFSVYFSVFILHGWYK